MVEVEAAPRLARSLGYWDLILYGLAYISPFAPLTTLGFVWNDSNGLIVLAYVLGGICMYFTAKSYAIMTETVPNAGSVYGFAHYALGSFVGFIAGWMILLDYLIIPAFCYILFSIAMSTLLPAVPRAVWIMLLVLVTTIINWYGIKVTARANLIAVTIQTAVIVIFIGFALFALYHGHGSGALTLAPLYLPARLDTGHLLAATSIGIMSFLGFDAISTLAEEVKGGDRRIVSRAIVHVLVIASLFFIGVTLVLGNLLEGFSLKDPSAAVYELAAGSIGAWCAALLAWTNVGIVALSNSLPTQVGVARVVFAMSRDRQLPRFLAAVHVKYSTPYSAMLATTAISLGVGLYLRDRLDELTSIVNFGALSGFLLLHASVFAHFALKLRSRSWFVHWLVPLVGAAVVLTVFVGLSSLSVRVGLTWLGVGLLYGAVLKRLGREEFRVPA
jgi:amino acid transporter